jgi:hypothetical protein
MWGCVFPPHRWSSPLPCPAALPRPCLVMAFRQPPRSARISDDPFPSSGALASARASVSPLFDCRPPQPPLQLPLSSVPPLTAPHQPPLFQLLPSSVPPSTALRQSPLRTRLTVVPTASREDLPGRRWQDASYGASSYVPFPAFPGPPLDQPSFPFPSAPVPNENWRPQLPVGAELRPAAPRTCTL